MTELTQEQIRRWERKEPDQMMVTRKTDEHITIKIGDVSATYHRIEIPSDVWHKNEVNKPFKN
jgi:hypothetical protein